MMSIVIYIFAGLFLLLAAALLFTWWQGRHPGALLLAATYAVGAGLSLLLHEWWPLLVGFMSAWSLRMMGVEPGADQDAQK